MNGKPRILITGGFGNLGSWLCEHFYNQGYEVTILSKRTQSLNEAKYHLIQADITNYSELVQGLTMQFDYCIHTASYNEYFHDDYAKTALLVNALGTRNLIQALQPKGIKNFIYFSTFHVYGNQYDVVNEACLPNPLNDYASTHLFAEYYLRQFYQTDGFPSVICRLTNSYGAPKSIESSKWYLVLNDLVRSAYNGQIIKLTSNGQASRDFVWMGDVCAVSEKLLAADGDASVLNLSAMQNYKVIDLAYIVQRIYSERYNREIEVSLNKDDLFEHRETVVDNAALLKAIDHQFENKLEDEVRNIFALLEGNDG